MSNMLSYAHIEYSDQPVHLTVWSEFSLVALWIARVQHFFRRKKNRFWSDCADAHTIWIFAVQKRVHYAEYRLVTAATAYVISLLLWKLSTSEICWYFLRRVWTQIRPDRMSGLIWMQYDWHHPDGIPVSNFRKKTTTLIWKRIDRRQKSMKSFLGG